MLRPQPLRYDDITNSPERHISQEVGKSLIVDLMNAGEIACTAFEVPLKCKLGKSRIVVPVRSVSCRPHFECMDLRNYLSYQAKNSASSGATTSTRRGQRRLWTCPICGERARAEDLRVDDYFAHILQSVPANVDEVVLLPDGSFKTVARTVKELLLNDEEPFESRLEHVHIQPSGPSHAVQELLKQSKTFQRSLQNGEGVRTKKDLLEKVELFLEKERDALNALLRKLISANQIAWNIDEQTTPTNVAPAKSRASSITARVPGNGKSRAAAESMDITQQQDAIRKEEPASSKRGRGQSVGGAHKSSATAPAKRAKLDQTHSSVGRKDTTEDEEFETETQNVPQMIFRNRKFVLTSAVRVNGAGQPQFGKRLIRAVIEQCGGTVIDDFKGLGDDDEVYLIADTHYRTHKYLSALSLSVPCVHHNWIAECVVKGTFVDFKKYILLAGHALDPYDTIREYEWKPLKGQLMAGKKVWIHSKSGSNLPAVSFVELWSPVLSAVGAEVVRDDEVPQDELELVNWLADGGVDIIVTDASCDSIIVEAMEASESGEVVGSEWVIEALISGDLPDTNNARYRHNA